MHKGTIGTSMQVHILRKKRGPYKVIACLIPTCKELGTDYGYCKHHWGGGR